MFSFLGKQANDTPVRKSFFDFLAEMEKNLEIFYVMDQRQFISSGFITDVLLKVQGLEGINKYPSIVNYGKALQAFNASLKAYKDYEAWYTKDMSHKNPENAKKLHGLKHDLDERLKGMEAVIILAGQDLEREMLNLGLLKA